MGAFIGVAALAALSTTAGAGENFKFRGESADASFWPSEKYINTYVSALPVNRWAKAPPGSPNPSTQDSAHLKKYDEYHKYETLLSAWGSSRLEDSAFQIDKKLALARLRTAVDLHDWASDITIPVAVDLAWTGTRDWETI